MGYCFRTVLSDQVVSPELGTNLLTHVCGHFRAYATVDENPINNFSSGRLEPSNEVMNTIVHLPAEHPSIGLLSGRI
ncbi:hypothetical protein Y032_0020g120 [Ancylostoma ceylanicum]|uniref:Uncharacterized protein n=1 Tax=Ancylostoma ceylanicum TaxID=53326 RepID=A0A016V0U9_9BILA|nr:hypothetical protein Y032_0020g120 [Ancylostoma ceylanicum]